jgi:hypothetical protein
MSTWTRAEAETAFGRVQRARRRASMLRKIRSLGRCSSGLAVHEPPLGGARRNERREIPLESITGTLEPNRAAQFDGSFRPARPARCRWQRIWMAEHRGTTLPPISVVEVCCGHYAVRDGHHRISVAFARGAATIDAIVAVG